MTDPFHDLFRDAVRADAAPVPLDGLVARARRRRVLLVAGPALAVALIAGGSVAALQGGSSEAGPEQLLVTAEPTVTEGAAASPSVLASETASASARPSATSEPVETTAEPMPTTVAPTTPPSPVASSAPPPARSGKVTVAVRLDRTAITVGQVLVARVTVTNGTDTSISQVYGYLQVKPGNGVVPASPVTGRLQQFRERALSEGMPAEPFDYVELDEPEVLDPGESWSFSQRWTASTPNGSAVDAEVPVLGTATYFVPATTAGASADAHRHEAHLGVPDPRFRRVEGQAVVALTGGSSSRLTPVRALDAALADPTFASIVTSTDPDACSRGALAFSPLSADSTDDSRPPAYSVEVCQEGGPDFHNGLAVRVDAVTGQVGEPTRTGVIA